MSACLAPNAHALDPSRPISEYARESWDIETRFPGGPVHGIAQTPDGYLWIAAEKGLVRFDGLNFRLFNQANSPGFPDGPVLDVMADWEGNLWIRPQSRNMLRYRDGVFHDVMPDLDRTRLGISAMCMGPKGEVLLAVRSTGIFTWKDQRFEKVLSTEDRSNFLVISMAKARDNKVWIGTRDNGLFTASGGQISAVRNGLPDRKVNSLLSVNERELWVGTDNGIVRWNGEELTAVADQALDRVQVLAMTRDRDSNLWIGTSKGLLRLNASGATSDEEEANESSAAGVNGGVNAVFEDREGNLWVGSNRGLERLRDIAFTTHYVSRDLPQRAYGAFYLDAGGLTWFAPSDGGLYWRRGTQSGQVKEAGLDRDVIYSMAGGKGELWVGRQRGGLTHLRYDGSSFKAETYTEAQGLARGAIYAVLETRDRTVWAGSWMGGVTRIRDGKLTTYTAANGLASDTVTSILESAAGTMWFGTSNGLSSLSQDGWRTYRGVDGLPPGVVYCLLEDSGHAIWIGTANGIAVLLSGQIRAVREAPSSLNQPIRGIAEDRAGMLWISTANRVVRVDGDKLLRGPAGEPVVREFGLADGLRSVEGMKRSKSIVMDSLGRIWVSTYAGLSVVDPLRVSDETIPVIVRVEGLAADGRPVALKDTVRIPGGRQRITLSFAGLSLSVPERIRFRYRLDDFDQDWSDVVSAREAVYTNLGPGTYRFRVLGSNSDGVWNRFESTILFEIEPVFWQTWWFRSLTLIAGGLMALVIYRARLRRVTGQLNVRFEERLAERTRIAQDLHDTLLQGFLSASMQLDVAADQLPSDSPAKPLVARVLQLMRHVIDEGRTALKGLRSSDYGPKDLAQSFSDVQYELAVPDNVDYRVTVRGTSRPLHPIIRDEVYRIGREALVNAFRHSRANTIEMEIEFGAQFLRLHVRDNGTGIDTHVLRDGRDGHWGLKGMRERAVVIGATLKLRSRAGTGTEVEVVIPNQIAFESLTQLPWWGRLPKVPWGKPRQKLKGRKN